MSKNYYSLHDLASDKLLKVNGIIAVILSACCVAMIVFSLWYTRIRVDPIATVSVEAPINVISPSEHVMSTAEFISLVKNNEGDTIKIGTKIAAYTTGLISVCGKDNKQVLKSNNIVIANMGTLSVVGTISDNQDVCAALDKLGPGESIDIASERPLKGHESKPVIMTVNDLR